MPARSARTKPRAFFDNLAGYFRSTCQLPERSSVFAVHASHNPVSKRVSRSACLGADPHREQRGSMPRAFAFQSSHDMISRNLAWATWISVSDVRRHALFTPRTDTMGTGLPR